MTKGYEEYKIGADDGETLDKIVKFLINLQRPPDIDIDQNIFDNETLNLFIYQLINDLDHISAERTIKNHISEDCEHRPLFEVKVPVSLGE